MLEKPTTENWAYFLVVCFWDSRIDPQIMRVASVSGGVPEHRSRGVGYGATYDPAYGAPSAPDPRLGETSTLSTRHPSMSRTSKECPSSSKRSPAAGTRPRASITIPPTVW